MPRRWLVILLPSALCLLLFAAWQWLIVDLPSLDRLTENAATPSTKILARDGRLLYEVTDPAGRRHTTLPLSEIPLALQRATIATEDAGFYSNPGVDMAGIARAAWINLTGGEVLAGGSTLTQQVARNMLLDPEERASRTLTRKLRESILAWRLAQAYSKEQVLELYLNQTYYGHLAYGVETAAQTYFGKSARELDLAEAALIAGLPQAPAPYDPLLYPDAAKERQAVVLDLMVKQGYASADETQLAKDEPLQYASTAFPIEAPHFAFYVWNLIEQKYGPEVLYSGLTITTTLDLDLTRAAEGIVRRRLAQIADDTSGPAHNATNAALVALDPRTGQVLALVGSPDYFNGPIAGAINMAVAPRQPGSALKPVVYAAAFSPEGCGANHPLPVTGNQLLVFGACPLTPATMMLDVRTAFVTKEGFSYVPQNYDRAFHGPVSAREALAGSLNLPAVLALDHVGLPATIRLAGRMGITTLADADRFGLALALGGGEVRLLDLAGAYGVFANGGILQSPTLVLDITDTAGRPIFKWQPTSGERVLDQRVAYLITDILADNAARAATFGFNSVLQIGRPAAVKTGTTQDYRDNWTVGFTPDLVAGVWVGNANNSAMINLSGVSGAGPIWHDFMREALAGKPESAFTAPPGLVRAEVCVPSGQLPTSLCPRTRTEWFIEGTAPTQPDTLYQEVEIDARTGQPADSATPPEARLAQVSLVLPPAAREWALANGLPQPVAELRVEGSNEQLAAVKLSSPDPQTIYQISPRLPRASQRVPFRVITNQPLTSITFILNDMPVASLTAGPFEWWWPLEAGSFQLKARATLANGETVETDSVGFVVNP
jgi:membrane peptidoglycan carboxypeptidase